MIETAFRLEQVKNVPDHETVGGELGASWSMKTVASKKTKTQWEKWYETIKEEEKLQSNKDVAVQCIDFCEVTTSDVYAVLRHAPPDLRGGTLLQHPVFWWQLWHIKKTHISAYRSSMQPGSIPGLLEEIRRQSSVRGYPEWPCNRDYQCRDSQCVLSQGMVNRICESCRKNSTG